MGKKAIEVKKATVRKIRSTMLSLEEQMFLRANAAYEGSPHHKRSPGDFRLTPPAAPRPDKTLCDEAGVKQSSVAGELLAKAIEGGIVSEASAAEGFPKQLWVVDEQGRVFEAMYGGSRPGRYHGYPIRQTDPLFEIILKAWADLQ